MRVVNGVMELVRDRKGIWRDGKGNGGMGR